MINFLIRGKPSEIFRGGGSGGVLVGGEGTEGGDLMGGEGTEGTGLQSTTNVVRTCSPIPLLLFEQ